MLRIRVLTPPSGLILTILAICSAALLLIGCNTLPRLISATPRQATTPTALPTTSNRWLQMMLTTPYPWSTPLPPSTPTDVDGNYAKLDESKPQWYNCRRCADFLPAGGEWRLQLDKGIYRIYYAVTQWRSLGSFTVADDRIYFFNDPNCPRDVGVYRLTLEDGALSLEAIEDACAINMRAANFSKQPWLSCSPPEIEAAITDHWQKPAGCME